MAGRLTAMQKAEPVQILLQLESGETISGQIRVQSGPNQSFYGWLELTNLLEGIRAADVPSDLNASPESASPGEDRCG